MLRRDYRSGGATDAAAAIFDMLQWMDEAATADFLRLIRRRYLRSGQTIYAQEEPGAEMYRVISGLVRLSSRQSDGREAVFLLFKAGDCFGVSSLVDGDPRPQTAECLTAVELEVLSAGGFAELLARHSSFNKAVMRVLARQMRVVSGHYTRSNLTSLAGRVATRILELARVSSDPADDAALIVTLPQSELAAMAGASRQSVNKVLQTLQQQGVLRMAHRAIYIHDIHALRRWAEAE